MTFTGKIIIGVTAFTLIIFTSLLSFSAAPVSSAEIEETADMIIGSDTVVTGLMDEYSGRTIVVDKISYRLCKSVKIFTPRNKMIHAKDLEGAEEVKLFRSNRCVRKIKVLRFAQ